MRIAGLEKSSFVDYPGKLAAVVFTPGCNMNCFYCHNRQLLSPDESDNRYDVQGVLEFLHTRRFLLDGVVITGGEPTLQDDLGVFIFRLRDMGFMVKLDTNGMQPWVLRSLIEQDLLDFVAMDIKAPLEIDKYEQIAGENIDLNTINESIDLLMGGAVNYEFRTTFAPQLSMIDITKIATRINGARSYVLQQYRPPGLSMDMFGLVDSPQPHSEKYICDTALLVRKFVAKSSVRGLQRKPEHVTSETQSPSVVENNVEQSPAAVL